MSNLTMAGIAINGRGIHCWPCALEVQAEEGIVAGRLVTNLEVEHSGAWCARCDRDLSEQAPALAALEG
jgi:Zn finger protein HypA/HybF involved in hydrogenase expression